MSPEQQAAYINAQVACALIKTASMTAENHFYMIQKGFPKYGEDKFLDLINEYGIHHNATMGIIRG